MVHEAKLAVIGDPIAHSLSPELHQHWIELYGVSALYEKIAVHASQLSEVVERFKEEAYLGFNITVPHKETMLSYLDHVDESVRAVGAVNTVKIEQGKLLGYNTDGGGFIQHLTEQLPAFSCAGKSVVLLGAGGAARAIIYGLMQAGVEHILVGNRTHEKALQLQAQFSGIEVFSWEQRADILKEADLLVNTTVLGMTGKAALDLDLAHLSSDAVVYDIVYNPLQTPLLKAAKERGCATIDGLGMLIGQGALAFEVWFGKRPASDALLRQKLLAKL